MQKDERETKVTSNLLILVALLLAFILIMVFLWQWYDLKNNSLEKQSSITGFSGK